MDDDPDKQISPQFKDIAVRLYNSGIDERAHAAERDARLLLMKEHNPKAVSISELIGDEDPEKQLAAIDKEYARIQRESEEAARIKQNAQNALVEDRFPPPPMKER